MGVETSDALSYPSPFVGRVAHRERSERVPGGGSACQCVNRQLAEAAPTRLTDRFALSEPPSPRFAGEGEEGATRHGRARPGHPRASCMSEERTWMPGTRPGMTQEG